MRKFLFVTTIVLAAAVGTASAQTPEPAKMVGRKGATQMGISFSTTTPVALTEAGTQTGATTLNGSIDIGRFVTNKLVTRFGVFGSGSFGGQRSGGSSPVSFMLLGGVLYYFTPDKVSSLYLGGDSSVAVSSVGSGDPNVNGRLGVQTAIRHNASFFVEGGYGGALTSSEGGSRGGSLMTNVGIRVLF
jgi:hypothetical protein